MWNHTNTLGTLAQTRMENITLWHLGNFQSFHLQVKQGNLNRCTSSLKLWWPANLPGWRFWLWQWVWGPIVFNFQKFHLNVRIMLESIIASRGFSCLVGLRFCLHYLNVSSSSLRTTQLSALLGLQCNYLRPVLFHAYIDNASKLGSNSADMLNMNTPKTHDH